MSLSLLSFSQIREVHEIIDQSHTAVSSVLSSLCVFSFIKTKTFIRIVIMMEEDGWTEKYKILMYTSQLLYKFF